MKIGPNMTLEEIQQTDEFQALPEDVRGEALKQIAELKFAIMTEFDECEKGMVGLAANVDFDLNAIERGSDVDKACRFMLIMLDRFTELWVHAATAAHNEDDPTIITEVIKKFAVFGEVMASKLNMDTAGVWTEPTDG